MPSYPVAEDEAPATTPWDTVVLPCCPPDGPRLVMSPGADLPPSGNLPKSLRLHMHSIAPTTKKSHILVY